MVNYGLHPKVKRLLGGLLLSVSWGLGMGAPVGHAAQLVGETLKNRAKSAADAASSAAQSSSAPGETRQTAKRGQAPFIPAAMNSPTIVGRRDPFKLPGAPGPGGEVSIGEELRGPLPKGPRGLVISQLRLEGIVRLDQSNTMIAVVTNYTNRAYFLRENDAVYNGVVSKITPDSISFKENYLDHLGRAQVREISRRLSGAPGEGR